MKDQEITRIADQHGINHDDARSLYTKFSYHHYGTERRGLETELTFDDYLRKAKEAGINSPAQIGRTNDQFVLARYGDVGNYTNENCRFVTGKENRQEAWANGRCTAIVELLKGDSPRKHEIVKKISEAQKGRTKETHEYIAIRAAKVTGRTAKNHAGVALRTDKISKSFVAISPSGEQYTGRNLTEFCRQHGLQQANFSAVCRGDRSHTLGWTGYYTE